jgi:hypothetical protein
MSAIGVLTLGILLPLVSHTQNKADGYQAIREGFTNPRGSALPKAYWWWLNGNVNPVRLKEELLAMKNAGIVGVDIFDIGGPEVPNPNNMIPAGPPFMEEESLQYIKFAIEEAGKLDFEVNLSVSSSWNAGGKWTKPENAAKTLYSSKVIVNGPKRQKISLPFPEITPDAKGNPRPIAYRPDGKPLYYEEVVVLAIPVNDEVMDTANIINVSRFFRPENEILDWKIPEGQWEIRRYVCANSGKQLNSPSPNSNGLVIDHFDSAATRSHLTYFIDRLKPLIGDFKKTALKGFYLASYEASDLHWTPSLPAEFRKLNGYEIYKFIPAIFNTHLYPSEITEDFQFDFRRTKSEMMINNHYRKAKEICNKHGLNLISESGGPGGWHSIPVEAMKSLGSLDIPRGEFWNKYEVHDIGDFIDVKWLIKEIGAASHIYKKGFVEAEAFTSWQHWQEGPLDLKPLADRAFCEGMNRVIIHGFSHEPLRGRLPGIGFYAGTHFNDRNTWWPKARPFNEYMGRISHVLQKTKFVADVLYYNGNDVPNLVPPKNTHFAVAPGYDYEVINTDILLNELTVEDGELSIPGVGRYKVLYIGERTEVDAQVLIKLTTLAKAGALIIGKKPLEAQGLSKRKQADETVKRLANEFWIKATANDINTSSFKKGKIYSNILPIQALNELKIRPDFSYYDPQSSSLDYIHYKTDSLDFYFVRNTTDQWVSRKCSFRQQGKIPEIWDPVSGKINAPSIYELLDTHAEIPLTWAPYASYFIVFRNGTPSSHFTNISAVNMHAPRLEYTTNGLLLLDRGTFRLNRSNESIKVENEPVVFEVDGEWKVTFQENRGAPSTAIFPELVSWTEAEQKGINYFSGTATYYKTFNLKNINRDDRTYLDLGSLAEVSEVWFNDQHMGITWTQPHRFDITGLVREGANTIRVEVANTWSNRLIGDAKTNDKLTDTNIPHGNANLLLHHHIRPNNVKTPWSELPLRRSGLLGPVTISSYKIR